MFREELLARKQKETMKLNNNSMQH